jgi:2-oxoglutarate ferredoxin oxidoreductase subunit alpha
MNQEISVRIAGEAGMGMQTVGTVFCSVLRRAGYHIFANQDYMSRIRGGNNFFQIRVAGFNLYCPRVSCNILVALDGASPGLHAGSLAPSGIMIFDHEKYGAGLSDSRLFEVPLHRLAVENGGSELFVNSVACGFLAYLLDLKIGYVHEALHATFGTKGEEIVRKNIDAANAGYSFGKSSYRGEIFRVEKGAMPGPYLMNGNDAIVLGAVAAGCTFYSAYPMTPSTSIMEGMAYYEKKGFPIIVEQAEDEIAAINMVIGASFAGARSMASTSGGGFALMVEGLSLAGMTETPVVIVDAQRPAPATGFPTRTEQADLNFLIHAGHGEFARAIFAPGTAEEAFFLTWHSFNIAEEYQIPVLIMTDQFLADSYRDIEGLDFKSVKIIRHIASEKDIKQYGVYKRYRFTDSGISPRAIPSRISDVVYVDSDEHTEEGHITEDAEVRIRMVEKRYHRKMALLSRTLMKPKSFNLENAECVLIGYGSTYGVMKEVCASVADNKIGFIHLSQVWPFPSSDIVGMLGSAKKKITVEGNAGAQLAGLIRRETGISVDTSILKYDGRPISFDYLMEKLKGEL